MVGVSHQLLLTLFPGLYVIARFSPQENLRIDYARSSFFAMVKTDAELAVVCEQGQLPPGARAERDRRLLRVDSVLTFALTGILSSLVVPLAEAAISVFAVSSYDTDYILIADREIEQAVLVLEAVGHKVHRSKN
jgi:hypothetical protein